MLGLKDVFQHMLMLGLKDVAIVTVLHVRGRRQMIVEIHLHVAGQ